MEIERSYFLRKIDELGRIVLPIEMRKALDINTGDTMKVYIQDGKIIIENKYII